MAGRALLTGYPRYIVSWTSGTSGWVVVAFSKVVATFNHVVLYFFMATTGNVWIIPSFRILDYVLYVEHVSWGLTRFGGNVFVRVQPLLHGLQERGRSESVWCHNSFHWSLSLYKRCFLNILRPRQNSRHFADDIFKRNVSTENYCISIPISLKFVLNCLIDNNPSLVQLMAWCRIADNPLSDPMVA